MARQLKQNTAGGARIAKPPLLKIFTSHCIVLAVVSLGLVFFDKTTAYSVLLGGMIFIFPNAYFAFLAFRHSGAKAAQDVARSLYRGEIGKFVLTAAAFACVFALIKPLSVGALFTMFIAMMVLNGLLVHRLSSF